MSQRSPLSEVLARLQNVRPSGAGHSALCPAHDDHNSSLSIGEGDDGRVLLHCHAGCTPEEIVAALGLTLADLFPEKAAKGSESEMNEPQERPPLITVDDLARDKRLPAEFLRKLGLEDCPDGVVTPYRLCDGTLADRHRVRTARVAKDGSFWTAGKGAVVPYGLWRLHRADKGFLVLVEGESDSWTLWYHGLPCLGLPGADTARLLEANYLASFKRLYVVREPDDGGAHFVSGIVRRLTEIGWNGEFFVVTLSNAKDANELHKRYPKTFGEKFRAAMLEARQRKSQLRQEGGRLLKRVEDYYRTYLVLPPRIFLALAVWTLATWCFEIFECFAYLAIMSPLKRCGKTRLTEVAALLAARALRTVNISEAALFRLIERDSPTLILDEAEALTGKSDRAEAIRALLNAGNRRDAVVPRCVGSSHEVQLFSVFCPKVVVGIVECPDTVRDRSILIQMQRKRRDQRVARFLMRAVRPEAEQIRNQASAVIGELATEISAAYNSLAVDLSRLEDRDQEMWEPLFAVLSVVDPSRVDELMKCALLLTKRKAEADEDESITLKLLADVRKVWPKGSGQLFTRHLIARLQRLEESPWADDPRLTNRKLARLLRPFGLRSRTVRVGEATGKGYLLSHFEIVFARYLVQEV